MKKIERWVVGVIMTTVVLLSSCTAWEPDLGEDLLPPGDNVFLYHDTIFEISAYTVSGLPIETSDRSRVNTTLYLLGGMEDTITGLSKASVFTQFNTTSGFYPANNTEIDSMVFSLYISDFFGNTDEAFTIRLHEATRRIYMDSAYFSNFELEGAYDPSILAETTINPQEGDTVVMLIENEAFIQKFLDVQADTALFFHDSIFKDYFNGFYLTATSSASEGAIARVAPSNLISRLSVKYANDSTEVDSTAERDFRWATFSINEFSSQKINIFEHDYSGVSLSKIIDRPDLESSVCYVQGMAGPNTRLSIDNMEEWIGKGKVAINSATMVFDIYPEDLSGIALDELPSRLMISLENGSDSLSPLQDWQALYLGAQGNDSQFGGQLSSVSKGMFFDTTYSYSFNIPLQFQSMVDGVEIDNSFRLQLYDAKRNPKVAKLWSNLFTNPKRIRLEVVYIKL